jgi:hypothetical protein
MEPALRREMRGALHNAFCSWKLDEFEPNVQNNSFAVEQQIISLTKQLFVARFCLRFCAPQNNFDKAELKFKAL